MKANLSFETDPLLLVYVDTSAYLTVLLKEEGWENVVSLTKQKGLCSSSILLLETHRTLIRLFRENVLTAPQISSIQVQIKTDMELFLLKDLTLDLCGIAPFPAVHLPKSLDLIHLRTALWFHQQKKPLTCFVSKDQNQLQAALEIGLPVAIP